ncbi:MAG: NADPH-dependent oxidoreductase [Planctomycetota bacterium]|nr:MAG: NADPH-dependent oxidoreductase [Planctomycetota bacterium]
MIRITQPDTRREIAALAGNQPYIESAPAFFIICADSRRHRLLGEAHAKPYDTRLEAFLVATIDASLFAQNLTTAFESLGYGICYIGGIRSDLPRLDALLQLPEGVYPLFGLCVGTPAQDPSPRPRLPLDAVLMHDRYDDDAVRRAVGEYDQTYRDYLRARNAPEPQVQQAWAARMADYHAAPRRPDLAAYYTSKGARLD